MDTMSHKSRKSDLLQFSAKGDRSLLSSRSKVAKTARWNDDCGAYHCPIWRPVPNGESLVLLCCKARAKASCTALGRVARMQRGLVRGIERTYEPDDGHEATEGESTESTESLRSTEDSSDQLGGGGGLGKGRWAKPGMTISTVKSGGSWVWRGPLFFFQL